MNSLYTRSDTCYFCLDATQIRQNLLLTLLQLKQDRLRQQAILSRGMDLPGDEKYLLKIVHRLLRSL